MLTSTTRRLSALALAGVLSVSLAACSSSSDDSTGDTVAAGPEGDSEMVAVTDFELAGSWVLEDNADITLTIEKDGTASGKSACNNYTTTMHLDGDTLVVGPAASTMMMCEEDVMAAETAYLDALQAATEAELGEGSLTLITGDGDTLAFSAA